MNPTGVDEIVRMVIMVGGLFTLGNTIVVTLIMFLGFKRGGRKDDQEEGARREQLRNLLAIATKNEQRWDEHDREVDRRVEEFRQTQATVRALAETVEATRQDARDALVAASAASKAITDLATGIAVNVRIGQQQAHGGTPA